MRKIFYTLSESNLALNMGKECVTIDTYNSNFSNFVVFLNRLIGIEKVTLYADRLGKDYYLILRALFHSSLSIALQLKIIYQEEDYENVMYPLSKMFGSHLKLIKRELHCVDVLISRPRFHGEGIKFYIITNGKNEENLRRVVETLEQQEVSKRDVYFVCGHVAKNTLSEKFLGVNFLMDDVIYDEQDKRFPLSKKKNLILDYDDGGNVAVILHDRIYFNSSWLSNLIRHAPYFDLYTCQIKAGKKRYLDKFVLKFKGYPTLQKCHYYLSLKEDNTLQAVDGGFFVLNRAALGKVRFDDRLHWGEMEDVDFVVSCKQNGLLVTFDPDNQVYSQETGHFSMSDNFLMKMHKMVFRRFDSYWKIFSFLKGIIRKRGEV